MANKEDYLDALTAYSKSSSREVPAILEQYLSSVAKNGETLFHWQLLKPLVMGKMDQVLGEIRQKISSEHIPDRPNVENVRFDVMRDRLMEALGKFNGAPFTIQRLCELLVDPKRHYRRSDKFLRGLEKNVLVVSTVDPFGRKVVSESGSKHLVNGIDTNGSPFFSRDSNVTSNLPPVPEWVTTTSSTRSQYTPKAAASEQKPLEQTSLSSSTPASGCLSGNTLSSLDGDQKEAAVHSEVVVEETVVTMDTSEAGTVATDGGEAMAEVDDNEEEMQGDDTSASSSSSSPEELPVSDTGESSAAQIETNSAVSSSTPESPWTSDTNEAENMDTATTTDCNQYSSDSLVPSHIHPSPDKQTEELTSSSEASLAQVECSEKSDVIDTSTEASSEPASESTSCSPDEHESPGDGLSASTSRENATSPTDLQCQGSDSGDSCSMTASDAESDSSPIDTDDMPSSTASSSSGAHLRYHEPLSSNTSSFTEVLASSSTDLLPSTTPVICAESHDNSEAGLERLIESADTSVLQAPVSAVLTPPSLTGKQEENSESSPSSSSVDSSLDCEVSETIHHRLLDEASVSTLPTMQEQESASETEAASSSAPSATPDLLADITSDYNVRTPTAPSEDQKAELYKSPTSEVCSSEDMGSSSVVSSELGSSPQPQLSPPGDSQGFDVVENTSRNNSVEEK
ncbi:hypothetical protein BsWGS_11536 [Bradybaena similaris]